jgi:beta-lactamase class A
MVDPARNFISQEDFIVNIQPLREYLRSLVAENSQYTVSVYFEVLNTGANISINPDTGVFPASLAKLPLALASAKKVEDGEWRWDNQLVMLQQDQDRFSGNLYQRGVGTPLTIEELVRELLINSDNTAYKILLRNLDSSDLVSVVDEIGLQDLFKAEGRISAKEYTRMLRALYTSSYLRRENSSKILEWMTQSSFDDYLAAGLPDEVIFAHKIGENVSIGTYADAGIVYARNRPYTISVMIQTDDDQKSQEKVLELMKQISQKTYEYVSSQ